MMRVYWMLHSIGFLYSHVAGPKYSYSTIVSCRSLQSMYIKTSRNIRRWNIFQVKVQAVDQGFPQKTGEATVEVQVVRDRGELRFSSSSYATTISENKEVDTEVLRVTASPSVCPYFNYVYITAFHITESILLTILWTESFYHVESVIGTNLPYSPVVPFIAKASCA